MSYIGEGSTFFGDQDVLKEDLNNIEYTKTKMLRETTRRTLSQPGVCALGTDSNTLKVVNGTGINTFTISPGTAVDGYGRLIEVPLSTVASGSVVTDPYYHPAWPDREDIAHGKTPSVQTVYYVHLKYTTQTGIDETDDSGESYSTRRYDSYEVVVNQASASKGDSVLLAGLTVDGGTYNISSIVDLRSFYTALTPTATSLTGHQRTFHESGIGGDNVPIYTGTGALNAINQGSLGITIQDFAGNKQATFNEIEDFININGTYLTAGLLRSKIMWTYADLAGDYIVYLTQDKRVERTNVNNFTAAQSVNVFPLFHLHWDGNTVLSVRSDLRKWNVADPWVGNCQFASGSLTLNSGSSARVFPTSLNFIDNRASLRYDPVTDVFFLSKDLRIKSHNIVLDVPSTETSRIFFNRDGKYIYWDQSDQSFIVSDNTIVWGSLKVRDDLNIGTNKDNTITTSLNFNLDSPFSIALSWDSSDQRFEFSKDVYVQGKITAYDDISTYSDVQVHGRNMYLNWDGPDGNSNLYFYDSSSPTGQAIQWNNTSSRFDISSTILVTGDIQASADLKCGEEIYVDYGSTGGNGIIYFSDEDAKIEYDRAGGYFVTDAPWTFQDPITAAASGSIFNSLTVVNDTRVSKDLFVDDDLAVGSTVQIGEYLRVGGNIYLNYDGPDGNSAVYFYDGSPIGQYIRWSNSNDRFEFSDDVHIKKSLTLDGNLTINNGDYLIVDGASNAFLDFIEGPEVFPVDAPPGTVIYRDGCFFIKKNIAHVGEFDRCYYYRLCGELLYYNL